MKRLLKIALLLGILTLLLCVSAYADDPGTSGIYGLTVTEGFTVVPDTVGEETTVNGEETTFYSGAKKLTVTLNPGENNFASYYLALALSDVGEGPVTPTASNIHFIDQKPGASTVDFLIYPDKLESGKEYSIYIVGTGDESLTLVATFKYYQPYTLGDVDDDKYPTATDALWILQYCVGNREFSNIQIKAGDVDHDESVTATDALWILQYSVGSRTFE